MWLCIMSIELNRNFHLPFTYTVRQKGIMAQQGVKTIFHSSLLFISLAPGGKAFLNAILIKRMALKE